MESEFVSVPKEFKGHVIGKGGQVIKEIRKRSGTSITSASKEEEGFTVNGNADEIKSAKRLILEKVEERKKRKTEGSPGELVKIPEMYKGIVIGTGGDTLSEISTQTGAEIIRKWGEVYITNGTKSQMKKAKLRIWSIMAGARLRGVGKPYNRVCCYIDGWNLPEASEFKLEPVEKENTLALLETVKQYRLRPTEEYQPLQESSCSENVGYESRLKEDALQSLRMIKHEQGSKADMWCHFGKVVIRGPDEAEVLEEERWSINEATKKFRPQEGQDYWRIAFKEGVNIDEHILERNFGKKSPKEYYARHDLTFLAPSGHELRCKVWVMNKDVDKTVKDKAIPFSDVKNILDEIHFEDEVTRSRCRGWLVLPSRRYLQADIFFPGCDFDCRITLRKRSDNGLSADYVPEEEVRHALLSYLSKLTFTFTEDDEVNGPHLPAEETISKEFFLRHRRCSHRTVFEPHAGFSILISKEMSLYSDVEVEEKRETIDLHLHCKDWDEQLKSEDWQPEGIVEKLSEFLQFVKQVQSVVCSEGRQSNAKS